MSVPTEFKRPNKVGSYRITLLASVCIIACQLSGCEHGNIRIVIYKLWSGFRVDPASMDNDKTVILIYSMSLWILTPMFACLYAYNCIQFVHCTIVPHGVRTTIVSVLAWMNLSSRNLSRTKSKTQTDPPCLWDKNTNEVHRNWTSGFRVMHRVRVWMSTDSPDVPNKHSNTVNMHKYTSVVYSNSVYTGCCSYKGFRFGQLPSRIKNLKMLLMMEFLTRGCILKHAYSWDCLSGAWVLRKALLVPVHVLNRSEILGFGQISLIQNFDS